MSPSKGASRYENEVISNLKVRPRWMSCYPRVSWQLMHQESISIVVIITAHQTSKKIRVRQGSLSGLAGVTFDG
jgi:hypothetical protein